MSYASSLPELAARERQELRFFERLRREQRAQVNMCAETRKAMLTEFFNRQRARLEKEAYASR